MRFPLALSPVFLNLKAGICPSREFPSVLFSHGFLRFLCSTDFEGLRILLIIWSGLPNFNLFLRISFCSSGLVLPAILSWLCMFLCSWLLLCLIQIGETMGSSVSLFCSISQNQPLLLRIWQLALDVSITAPILSDNHNSLHSEVICRQLHVVNKKSIEEIHNGSIRQLLSCRDIHSMSHNSGVVWKGLVFRIFLCSSAVEISHLMLLSLSPYLEIIFTLLMS